MGLVVRCVLFRFPEITFEKVRMEITLGDNPYNANDFNIQVARRSSISQVIEIE